MKVKVVLRVLAFICVIVSVAMLPPFLLALYDGTNDRGAFALSMSAGLIFSAICAHRVGIACTTQQSF